MKIGFTSENKPRLALPPQPVGRRFEEEQLNLWRLSAPRLERIEAGDSVLAR